MDIYDRILKVRKDSGCNQEEFASRLGLSRNFINQVENRKRNVSNRTLSDISKNFNVNEDWLKSGQGEPYNKKSKDEEIAEMLADVQLAGEDTFKHRLISALAQLDEDGWKVIEKFIDSVSDSNKAGD